MGALIDKAFDTLIFFLLEAVTTLLWLINLIELGFIQVTHYFHKWVLDALPDIFEAFLIAVEELIIVFVVLAAVGLIILRIVKYIFPATAEGMPFFHFATRWFLISFLMGAPIVVIQQVDQWRISFGQDIRNATTAAMGTPLLPVLPGNVFTIYDIDGCPVWVVATPPCIEIGDVSASFVGVEAISDLDTALPPAFNTLYFPYGDTTTFGNLSDSERSDAINLARDGMFRMGLGILPNFLGGLDALLWVFLTFAFLFIYLALPITLPLAFFRRTEHFAMNTLMRGGELFIETGITAAFLGIITYALIAAANISDLVFVGLAFFALFPVGWRFLSALKTTNHSIGGMSVGSGAAAAATASAARSGVALATAGVSEVAQRGVAAVGAVDEQVSGAVRAGGKAARTAVGAGLIAHAARTADNEGGSSLTAAAGGALLGSSQRATTGLTLGYLAAEGRDDVAQGVKDVLSSAVIGTQVTRNPGLAVLLTGRRRVNGNGRSEESGRSETSGRSGESGNGNASGSGSGDGNGRSGSSEPVNGNGSGNGSGGNGAGSMSRNGGNSGNRANDAGGSAAPSGNWDDEPDIQFTAQGSGNVTRQAQSLASEVAPQGEGTDPLDNLPQHAQSRATRARRQMRVVRDAMPFADRAQFVPATAAVAAAVKDDVAALRDAGFSEAGIAARYRSESGILGITDRLAADNPYRAHPAAVRAVADAVLQPTRRMGAEAVLNAIVDTAAAAAPDVALANRLGVSDLGELGGKARMLHEQIQTGAIAQPVLHTAQTTAMRGDFAGAAAQIAANSTIDTQAARRVAVVLANLPDVAAPAYLDDTPVMLATSPAPFAGTYADRTAADFEETDTLPPLPDGLPPQRRQAARAVRQIMASADADTVDAVPDATRATVAAVQSETRALQDAGYDNRQIVERLRTDDGVAAVTSRLASDNPYRTQPAAIRGLVGTAIRPQTTAPYETMLNALYDTPGAAALSAQLSAAGFRMTPEQAAHQTTALRQAVTTHAIPRETLVRAGAYASEGNIAAAAEAIASGSQADSTAAHEVGVLLSELPPLYRDIAIGPELPPVNATGVHAAPATTVPLVTRPEPTLPTIAGEEDSL